MKKLARSGSLIVEELFGIKTTNKPELEAAEVVYESAFNGNTLQRRKRGFIYCDLNIGNIVPNDGLVKMTELQDELRCTECGDIVSWPMVHCRKGHLCCSICRKEKFCRICKQTFVDTQHPALDRLWSLIYLPCKYR